MTGTPGGPTAISIYLRAGWSLGPVQSRYILEGEGGGQVCDRAASELPLTDISFANLPPHFLRNNEECLSKADWEDTLPGFSTFYLKTLERSYHFYWRLLRIINSTWLSYNCRILGIHCFCKGCGLVPYSYD